MRGPRTTTTRRALAALLCACGLLIALLPGIAPARAESAGAPKDGIQTGSGGGVIRHGQNLVRSAAGCMQIQGGGKTLSAGDCSPGSTTGASSGPPDAKPSMSPPQGETTPSTVPGGMPPATTKQDGTIPATTAATTALTDGTTSGPSESEDVLCPSSPPKDAVKATVERAVDGDTLQLERKIEGTDRVRLIGVDTPELAGKNGNPEPYAKAAKKFTSGSLKGKDVLLAADKDPTDDYQRLLAYVWTTPGDGLMGAVKGMFGGGPALFNRTLLEKGYARVMTVPPNDRYAACFEAAQRAARSSGEGRWTTDGTTMPASTALGEGTIPTGATTTSTITSPDPTTTGDTTTPRTTTEETTSSPTLTTQATTATTSASPTTSATVSTQEKSASLATTPSPTTGTTSGTTPTADITSAPGIRPAPTLNVPEPAATPSSMSRPEAAPTTPQTLPDTWPPPTSGSSEVPAATSNTVPYRSLPQSTVPTGETRHLLPDTGGRSPLFLLIGTALVGAGLLIWRSRGDDRPERESAVRQGHRVGNGLWRESG